MAKVPRLNRTVIEQRVDPGAIGIAGQGARFAGDFIDDKLQEERQLQDLQEQTEIARRSAEFQNQAFDVISENEKAFRNDPDKGVEELGVSLRQLNENFFGGLSAKNAEGFRRVQEGVIGRFELQSKERAQKQKRKNIQDNVTATGKSYLESARLAGVSGDFDRINNIFSDVPALVQNARGGFVGAGLTKFEKELKDGIVETYTESLMENHTDEFILKLNDGDFDEIIPDEGDRIERLDDAIKLQEKKSKQARVVSMTRTVSGNSELGRSMHDGTVLPSQLSKDLAEGKISPGMEEIAYQSYIEGPVDNPNNVSVQARFEARLTQLVDKGVLFEESLDEVMELQRQVARASQIKNEKNGISRKVGDALLRKTETALANSVFTEGISDSLSIDHYKEFDERLIELDLDDDARINAINAYGALVDDTEVSEMIKGVEPLGALNPLRLLPGESSGLKPSTHKILKNVKEITEPLQDRVIEEVIKGNIPSLRNWQGDIPNAVIENGVIQRALPGGDLKGDKKIEEPFKRQKCFGSSMCKVFPDGTFEVEK